MLIDKKYSKKRTAAVTVEFAIIAPLLFALASGLCELGQAACASTKIAAAIREGGRLATMDFTGKLAANQTPNQKVQQDILNFLSVTGVKTKGAQVFIENASESNTGSTFDLALEENYLQLFRIRVVVPYSNVSIVPIPFMSSKSISASTVFRRGRISRQPD